MNFVVIQNFPFATQGHGNTKWLHQKVSTTSPGRNIAFFGIPAIPAMLASFDTRSYLLQAPNQQHHIPNPTKRRRSTNWCHASALEIFPAVTCRHDLKTTGSQRKFKDLQGFNGVVGCSPYSSPQLFRCFVWRDVQSKTLPERFQWMMEVGAGSLGGTSLWAWFQSFDGGS